jgi:hypothetical protein
MSKELFIPTETVVKGRRPGVYSTVKTLAEEFVQKAHAHGITNVHIHHSIEEWFASEKVSKKIGPKGQLVRFDSDTNHGAIIKHANELKSHQEYAICDAIVRATELVEAGELDDSNDRGIVIYLINTRHEMRCCLHVWRKENGVLELNVDKAYPNNVYKKGAGAIIKVLPK